MKLCFAVLWAGFVPSLARGTGPHRLQCELTETWDASLRSTIVDKEYLDFQFILCNGSERVGRAEIRTLLSKDILGAEPGATVTSGLAEDRKDLRTKLAVISEKLKQKGGSHSVQEVRGCEIQEDTPTRAFRRFFCNGEPFLFYDETTHGWEAPQSSFHTLALEIKKSWDTESTDNKNSWAQVRGDLCGNLLTYQKSWTGFTERKAVTVTCSRASEGVVSVTCRASGLAPRSVPLVWLQDDEPLSPDAQQPGGVLCAENGTCCVWVALRVPQGEEQSITYAVEHNLNSTVTYGKVQVHRHHWPVVAAILIVFVAAALWYFRFRKTSPGESPGPISLQDLSHVVTRDLYVTGPDQHLAGPQGSQPLLSAPESRESTAALRCCTFGADSGPVLLLPALSLLVPPFSHL